MVVTKWKKIMNCFAIFLFTPMRPRSRRSDRGMDSSLQFCQSMGRLRDKVGKCAYSGRQTYAKRCILWQRYTVLASPGIHYKRIQLILTTPFRTYAYCISKVNTDRIIAIEWLKGLHAVQWRRVTNPLDGLPVSDQPDIVHGNNGIKKSFESFLVMSCREPCSMVVQRERCSRELIMKDRI